MLEILNITVKHEQMHGVSLLPMILGEKVKRAKYAYTEAFLPLADKDKLRSVRTTEWKYIFAPLGTREELYNLVDDPGELINLVDTSNTVAQELKLQLLEIMNKYESTRPAVRIETDQLTTEALKALGYID